MSKIKSCSILKVTIVNIVCLKFVLAFEGKHSELLLFKHTI